VSESPCSTQDCPGSAVVAIAFHGQYGHVHHCAPCAAEAREWYDVATSAPLPCPYTHGDGSTWIDVPPDLIWPPADTPTEH
jgi:hypothetical protein